METILVTGPDGAGKSTLISKLKKSKREETAFFLVPIINQELMIADEKLSKTLYFINWLYLEAENLKVPGLRSLSLFAYMLVYSDVLADLKKQGNKRLICDRHPLIDSVIYGKLYAPQVEPDKIPAPVLAEIDYNFNSELFYLTTLLGLKKPDMPKGSCYHLSEFIYRFSLASTWKDLEELKKIFRCEYPTKVVYLSISAAALEQRLKNSRKQHTETRGESNQLVSEFEMLIGNLPVLVEKVDANDVGNLDSCAEKLSAGHF